MENNLNMVECVIQKSIDQHVKTKFISTQFVIVLRRQMTILKS
jgi:hypothetical protein